MQNTPFIEAQSPDPVVRDLCRRAMRLLNDPSLDRKQREQHIRRLQQRLLDHQAQAQQRSARADARTVKRERAKVNDGNNGNAVVANPGQVVARRKEFGAAKADAQQPGDRLDATRPVTAGRCTPTSVLPQGTRSRPVLTLARA